jgi:hypothetical protein
MTYDLSRRALNKLGRDARFENDIRHYNFRFWAANKVNSELLQYQISGTISLFDGVVVIFGLIRSG